jgi:hypothetical protein
VAFHRDREQRLANPAPVAFRTDVEVIDPAGAECDETVDLTRDPHFAFGEHALPEKREVFLRRVQVRQIGQTRPLYGAEQLRDGSNIALLRTPDCVHRALPRDVQSLGNIFQRAKCRGTSSRFGNHSL